MASKNDARNGIEFSHLLLIDKISAITFWRHAAMYDIKKRGSAAQWHTWYRLFLPWTSSVYCFVIFAHEWIFDNISAIATFYLVIHDKGKRRMRREIYSIALFLMYFHALFYFNIPEPSMYFLWKWHLINLFEVSSNKMSYFESCVRIPRKKVLKWD